MLTYSFTDIGTDCLYTQLYKCIKDDILSGGLKPDEKLPSKRSFAKNLGISTITVENAYSQLSAEGYIYSRPKSGFYVADFVCSAQKIKENVPHNDFAEITQKAEYVADFVGNHRNPDNFPFSIWAKIMRKVMLEKSKELMTDSPNAGVFELRKAICTHLKQFRNMDVSPQQVVIGAGTEHLYSILIQLFGKGAGFALEDPGYTKLSKILEAHEIDCLLIPVDKKGIIVEDLGKSGAAIVHTTPSHHFPTGSVSPVSRRYELLAWAVQKDERYIIEDDYDSELRLEGKPVPSLHSMDVEEKVIYMNTFTKTLASTIRISYMVLPRQLLTRYQERLSFYSCAVSNFEQYTLAEFIGSGYYEKHINRMRNHYRKIRNELLNEIENSKLKHIVAIREEAGLHFLIKINTDASDERIMAEGRKHHLNLACLSQYYHGQVDDTQRHVLIMNYMGISQQSIKQAISLLEKTMEACSQRLNEKPILR